VRLRCHQPSGRDRSTKPSRRRRIHFTARLILRMRPCDARAPTTTANRTPQIQIMTKNQNGGNDTEMTADSSRSRLRVILAASIGSALEWYDLPVGTAPHWCSASCSFRKATGGRHAAGVPDFGVGFVCGARRHPVRHHGRSLRAVNRFGGDAVDDRVGHHADRLAADLCQIGLLGAALLVAMRVVQGLEPARIWRRGDLLVENAPPKHRGFGAALRRSASPSAICWRPVVRAGDPAAARRPDVLGMAYSVPASFLLIMSHLRSLRITETPVFTRRWWRRQVEVTRRWKAEAHPRNFFCVLGASSRKRLGYLFSSVRAQLCHYHLGVPDR